MKYAFAIPAKLGITDSQDALPVYIQQHALLRMAERLSMQNGLILFTISLFFNGKPNAIHTKSGHLITFDYNEKKLGYLVVDLIDHKIIIKTFLFLTNDGTPEGEKLASITKLKKLDKKFLDLDTLKGISKLAIKEHSELYKLFSEAGCADLFELTDLTTFLDMDSVQKNPDMLLKYLQDNHFFLSFSKTENQK
ncbi:hypothetical protein [Pedobacter puniceum]|uniref:Uncharacterized protein n=1 Tax=Pedobacter puniceum TaxID=2666136 RepID=A0A7K0FND6_9SPHI|nr:hypothetical protein [Pedobacter puniceum]MRX46935.1 hypothetical protein [Pedobacter puniceum]